MAPPTATLATPLDPDPDFDLDMRVVEVTTPLVEGRCDTNDGCGSTCSGSACSTSSYDPA